MEKLPILCGAERIGEAEAERDSLYTCLRVRIPSRRGLWRAWAIGERGEMRIGTLEPVGGESVISRRFSRQSLSKVGKLARVEIRPASDSGAESAKETPANIAEASGVPGRANVAESVRVHEQANVAESVRVHEQANGTPASFPGIPATPEAWSRAGNEPLFRSARFRRQARRVRDALTRTDGDRRRVALPQDENAPFPIPELFCLASAARIGARDYWVFAFDRQEWPVL